MYREPTLKRQFLDVLFKWCLLHTPGLRTVLGDVMAVLEAEAHGRKEKVFYVLIGPCLAGKTTYARAQSALDSAYVISSRTVYNAFASRIGSFDLRAAVRSIFWRAVMEHVRYALFDAAFAAGYAVVSDACNLEQADRGDYIYLAKTHGYRVVLVAFECDAPRLLARAREQDLGLVRDGKRPFYQRLARRQLRAYDPPIRGEADEALVIRPDDHMFPVFPTFPPAGSAAI